MALLDTVRKVAGRTGMRGGPAATARWARARRRARRMTSALTAPVLAAASLVPAAAVTAGTVAGVAALSVASAAPVRAASGPSVAVVLVNGETTAPETAVLQAAGDTVTQVTPAQLSAMSESAFHSYAAVVIGDSSTSTTCSTSVPSVSSLGTNWEPWVNGNLAVLGTAPAMPGTSGADALITDAAGYAAAQPPSGSVTGLYLSLNCAYSTAAAGTDVSLLDSVDGIGTAGGVTVNGSLACTDPGTVNTWEADAAGTFGGFTSASLGTGSSGFPSPACPVREAVDAWPANLTPVGYDAASDATSDFTASDGVTGQPYILLGTPPATSGTRALAPSQGGEVPAGTTAGGADNPAAPGPGPAAAGDPVDTENGDFTQSSGDASVPTFGPGLDFTRTYDAQVAEQQTEAGTPGAMGYGWTDNWASSAAASKPAPGDAYTIDGLATGNGMGGPASQAAIGQAADVVDNNGNIYIADQTGNRVEEVAGASQTQRGITMTKGDVYTIAGSPAGAAGLSPNGTSAAKSLLNAPTGLAVDDNGNLFIADSGNNRIVELVASASTAWGNISSPVAGDVYTVAGSASGTVGTGGDGIAATSSDLDNPAGVFIGDNAGGNLYIADAGNNRVQMVSPTNQTKWGRAMGANDVYTLAGSTSGAAGSSGDGGAATAGLLDRPGGVGVDTHGDLVIADTFNCRVQEVPKANGAQWGTPPRSPPTTSTRSRAARREPAAPAPITRRRPRRDLDYPLGVSSSSTIGIGVHRRLRQQPDPDAVLRSPELRPAGHRGRHLHRRRVGGRAGRRSAATAAPPRPRC